VQSIEYSLNHHSKTIAVHFLHKDILDSSFIMAFCLVCNMFLYFFFVYKVRLYQDNKDIPGKKKKKSCCSIYTV